MTTIQEAAGQQVAKRDNSPGALIKKYSTDFTTVLPSHIKAETWIRVAQGALKKGKRGAGGLTDLEQAASNNPAAFLSAVMDAARQGLEPGTEEYYLTPRKVKGKLEILGITGWQGYVELMYRAGAVSSVVAECVYEKDTFDYQPGRDQTPQHRIDWDAEDRGRLRLVYAYAHMRDGSVSKIVVLNKAEIRKIRAVSAGADSDYSPWVKWESSMWLKSAVRQLKKWVPTSAEYRNEMRADAVAIQAARHEPTPAPERVDMETGEVFDAEIVADTPPDDPSLNTQWDQPTGDAA